MEDAGNQPRIEQTTPNGGAPQLEPSRPAQINSGFKAGMIVEYVFWVLTAVILLRFAFKLINANPTNAFVVMIYNFTNPVVNMFKGIVDDVVSGPMVIEFSSLISVAILWLIYKGLVKLIRIAR